MKKTAMLGGALVLLAVCVPTWGDVILEWNNVALQVNVIDHDGPDTPGDQLSDTQGPPASARVLALVHAAMFDAYNAIDSQYTPYLNEPIPSPPGASIDAAVAYAAHNVIVGLFPGDQVPRPEIREFVEDALQTTLSRVTNKSSRNKGRTVGKIVAKKLLRLRRDDGAFLGGIYTPAVTVGDHNVDPLNPDQSFISPDFGWLPPFGVADILAYRAPEPPSPNSIEADIAKYALAYEEVEKLGVFRGGETDPFPDPLPEDYDETYVIANYWSYNGSPGTGTPPRLYNQIVREIAIKADNDVSENARLFALVNIAMGDAGISSWDSKYYYRYWRPILGIRQVDFDGNSLTDTNPNTVADPDWSPLGGSRSNPFLLDPGPPPVFETNFSPPFPAYTSGHATFGAAAFKAVANFYQGDTMVDVISEPLVFVSDEWNGMTHDQFDRVRPLVERVYTSLNCLAAENAASRVFNGVHWRFDGTEGVRAGYGIADEIFDNLLRPLDGGGLTAFPLPDFEPLIDEILNEDEDRCNNQPTGP